MILAIDPGIHTGWARSDGACGTISFENCLWGEASYRFSMWLADQIDEGVKRIGYEMVFVRHQPTAMALGIVWDILRVAHVHELPIPISLSPLAKYKILGLDVRRMTRLKRGEMLRKHIASMGRWHASNQHEADAAALLLAAEACTP